MQPLIRKLQRDFPAFQFTAGSTQYWSPQKQQINYVNKPGTESVWGMFHELGHALLGHQSYETDLALLQKETTAWQKAEKVAAQYGITIANEYVQQCLDTYRDWLHKRSVCPTCSALGLQKTKHEYRCINCDTSWQVSAERFCRPYRRTTTPS